MNSDTFVCSTQLFYEFQHYNPVILLDVNLTIHVYEQSSLNLSLFSSTRISQYIKLQFVFLGNKEPKFLYEVGSLDVDRVEGKGSGVYFDVCRTKIPLWSIYGSIFLTIYSLEMGLREMKGIFSDLIFIGLKRFLDKFYLWS